MTKIQIICTNPGMRRHGVAHPATETYDAGRWTDDQLKAFRADPSFHVNEIDDNAVVIKGDEFDKAVAIEADKRIQSKLTEMQGDFAKAVETASAETSSRDKARIRELEAELLKVPALIATAVDECTAALETKLKEQEAEIASLKSKVKPAKA